MGYANIVTAVIGSGVLSLAWSMSWLGEHSIARIFVFPACLSTALKPFPCLALMSL